MLFEEVASHFGKLEDISSRLEMIDVFTDLFKKAKPGEIRNIIYMSTGQLAPPFEGMQIGMAEKLAEEAIAKATGAEKQKVADSFRKTGDLGLTAEQFVSGTKLRRMSHEKFEMNEVFGMLKKIGVASGAGSQDMKINGLANLLAASTPLEARFIIRFAMGQLRLGAGDATIMEALSKAKTGDREFKARIEEAYNICSDLGLVGEMLMKEGKKGVEDFKVTLFNPIRPALAERLPTAEQILERMEGSARSRASTTGSGCRCTSTRRKSTWRCSREGSTALQICFRR